MVKDQRLLLLLLLSALHYIGVQSACTYVPASCGDSAVHPSCDDGRRALQGCDQAMPFCQDGSVPNCTDAKLPLGTTSIAPKTASSHLGSTTPQTPLPFTRAPPTDSGSSSNTTIVAVTVSIVLLLVIIILVATFVYFKKMKAESQGENGKKKDGNGRNGEEQVQAIEDRIRQWEATLPPGGSRQPDGTVKSPERMEQSSLDAVIIEMQPINQNSQLSVSPKRMSDTSDMPISHSNLLATNGTHMTSATIGGHASQIQKEIQSGDYQVLRVIGRGAYGAVYSCIFGDGSHVAMKEVYLGEGTMDVQVAEVEKEMVVIEQIKHPNVVRYYGAKFVRREQKLLVFMDLITGGSLGGMVRNMQEPIREKAAQRYIRQIVEGLAHIHSKGVVHRDLKCDNILMTTEGQVKIADFGTARAIAGGGSISRGAQTMIGTPFFMAPEILLGADESDPEQGAGGYGRSADIWSLGITVAELLNQGNPPWPRFTNLGQAFLHISSDKGIPIVPSHVSADAKDFILQCCIRDPKKRPKADELLDHPWIVGAGSIPAVAPLLPQLVQNLSLE